eukprot:gnl/Spiro4/21961_TR10780_c0_g1_i2.p2 gnl/Spiro4/21961_TR10780_c0_g1~~gnl/Spiro4/21961_TR10780_c0_g1_i2.p2  ORF type:complete len:107 (+),score=10.17 gnl/Spiro4/21961_TR10780_c0_g1_i2:748-1068(+)
MRHSTTIYREPQGACPTLFVNNLPRDVTEREMSILFRFMPGFQASRLISKENKPICFVDFVDASSATMAMHMLQGYRLDAQHLQGITIEFDRGSLPRRRERADPRG